MVEAGRAWAAAVRSSLVQEGRRAAGGWPGTMTEARERLAQVVGAEPVPSTGEVSRLVRVLYGAARECWLMNRESAEDDD